MFLIFLCLLYFSLDSCVLGNRYRLKEITLDTSFGKIRGFAGKHYSRFTGIPYGLVNESDPFGNALPHPHLKPEDFQIGNLAVCPQHDKGEIVGKIQCLHLHIYTPSAITPGKNLPVMVYIHGLKFSKGSAAAMMFLPDHLVRHGVLIATVDYRLGPYGHLCIPNTEYTNQALKDQNLALMWIKEHIGSFGGDADNILLFGQDSGAVSVEHHLWSKEILFNKVILQSGVAVSQFWDQGTDFKTFVKDVGLGADNIDVDRFIQTISAIDTHTVINITKSYNFRPCIDGEFVRETPNVKTLRNIKLMIGGTSNEMLYFYPSEEWHEYLDFAAELNKSFSISNMADCTDAIEEVKDFYSNKTDVNIVDFASDLAFNYPMERTVNFYVQNKCTVFRYLFSYDGNRNYMKKKNNVTKAGAIHGDDLGYLFDMRSLKPLLEEIIVEDQVMVDRMSLMWTNFAKYGDPTPEKSELLPVKWTPVTAGAKSYLQIDSNLVLHSGRPFEERMSFWESYYQKYGEYAKGISLGEVITENGTSAMGLSKLWLITVLVLMIGSKPWLCS